MTDAVVECVERADADGVTLVGHSWGGYVITGVAPRLAGRLRKLVYWSAFVPRDGVPLFGEIPPEYRELFGGLAAESGDNSVAMPIALWPQAFMQDAPEDVQRLVHSLLVPQPLQYFTEAVPALTLDVPVAYVLSAEDLALPPGEYGWERFAARLGVRPVSTPGSHESCFTRPAELAESLLGA